MNNAGITSEYRGVALMANNSAAGCLAAAEAMGALGVNYALYPDKKHCYVCAVSGQVALRLQPHAGGATDQIRRYA